MQPTESLKNLIVYKDESIIVINKPAGIPVHKGRGGGANLEQRLDELQFDYPMPPILVHRLDRDTSGCLILGRNKDALRRVGKMFMAGRIKKTYWAVVSGIKFDQPEGRIDIPLRKKSPLKHQWWMEAHAEGQISITDYKVIGETENFTLLELYPLTGRTHQIRVHCQAIGRPIVGDKIYGHEMDDSQPLMHLHAQAILIPQHDKPPIKVKAPPPLHMRELLDKCLYKE